MPRSEEGNLPEVYLGDPEEPPQLPYRRVVRLRRRHRLLQGAWGKCGEAVGGRRLGEVGIRRRVLVLPCRLAVRDREWESVGGTRLGVYCTLYGSISPTGETHTLSFKFQLVDFANRFSIVHYTHLELLNALKLEKS